MHLRPAAVGVPRGRGADPGARHAAARRRHRSGREGRTRGVGMARYCPGAACHSARHPSPRASGVVLTLEGEGEDLSVIGEAQWFFSRWAFLKMNLGFGLSQKSPTAPEVEIMMSFRP